MADETPLIPNTPPAPKKETTSVPKKETVRITLPPKPSEAPSVKRETVRISQPPPSEKGMTMPIQVPGPAVSEKGMTKSIDIPSIVPKKESSKLPGMGAAPAAPKPFTPPPPAPKPIAPLGSAPLPPAKPVAPPAPAKPPTPATTPMPAAATAAPAPARPVIPKKETARIQVSAESKTVMPKATIKLQQAQPVTHAPAAAVRPADTAALSMAAAPRRAGYDWTDWALSIGLLVASFIAFVGSFLAYTG